MSVALDDAYARFVAALTRCGSTKEALREALEDGPTECSRGQEDVCPPHGPCDCRDDLQRQVDKLPQRIALCPEHAPEFYYPLNEGESLTCPCCPLQMIVYERKS